MGPNVKLIDTPVAASAELDQWLESHHSLARTGPGSVKIFSSDVTDALHRVVESLFPITSNVSIDAVSVERLAKTTALP